MKKILTAAAVAITALTFTACEVPEDDDSPVSGNKDKGVTAEPADDVEPSPTKKAKPPRRYVVTHVVDGDTLELGNGQEVRLVGIDTPERGQCGYAEATENLAGMVLKKQVTLGASDEDKDRYGRLLRYVDVGKTDAGLQQIKQGYAIARYDSRDGYGFHPRERSYIKADKASKAFTCPKPTPTPEPESEPSNCMAGYTPCLPVVPDLDCGEIGHPVTVTGSDPYRLDADGDGVGCDS